MATHRAKQCIERHREVVDGLSVDANPDILIPKPADPKASPLNYDQTVAEGTKPCSLLVGVMKSGASFRLLLQLSTCQVN